MTTVRASSIAALLLIVIVVIGVITMSTDPALMVGLLAVIGAVSAAGIVSPRHVRLPLRVTAIAALFLGIISLFSVGAPLLIASALMLYSSDRRHFRADISDASPTLQ